MQNRKERAARFPRTAPLSQPQAATALGHAQNNGAALSRQDVLSSAVRHDEAARADLVALIHKNQGAALLDHIAALSAIVALLRMSDRSLAPGEAAFIVDRTPATIISWRRRHAAGVKAGGRWIVDPVRLAVLLLGGAS